MRDDEAPANSPPAPPTLDWRPLSELRYDDRSVLFAAPRPHPYEGWAYDIGGASGAGAAWGWQFPGKPTHFARITPPQLADGEPYIPAPPKQDGSLSSATDNGSAKLLGHDPILPPNPPEVKG